LRGVIIVVRSLGTVVVVVVVVMTHITRFRPSLISSCAVRATIINGGGGGGGGQRVYCPPPPTPLPRPHRYKILDTFGGTDRRLIPFTFFFFFIYSRKLIYKVYAVHRHFSSDLRLI